MGLKEIFEVSKPRIIILLVITAVTFFFQPEAYIRFGVLHLLAFASIVAFFSWNKGVSIIGPNRASLFLHLIPVFSAIWAISFLNEKFAFFHVIGVLFILSGIILSNIKLSNE